jgi:uncharacterized OB-fold protein
MSANPVATFDDKPETAPFWRAASKGTLLLKRCTSCGEAHYFPRSICPFCFSSETVWEESSGEGEIYTFSVMRRASNGPYAIGFVKLREGPAILTNFVACDLPMFTPSSKQLAICSESDE